MELSDSSLLIRTFSADFLEEEGGPVTLEKLKSVWSLAIHHSDIPLLGDIVGRSVVHPSLPGPWIFHKRTLLLVHVAGRTYVCPFIHHTFALSSTARVTRTLSSASRSFRTAGRFGRRCLRLKSLDGLIWKGRSILARVGHRVYGEGRRVRRHGWRLRRVLAR